MRATKESIKSSLDKLSECKPSSRSSPMMILVAAARLWEEQIDDRELHSITTTAIDNEEHFPSIPKLLKMLRAMRERRDERATLNKGRDVTLEVRYAEAVMATRTMDELHDVEDRYHAICEARRRHVGRPVASSAFTAWRKAQGFARFGSLDDALAHLGLDHRGRPFSGDCPLQGNVAVVEDWQP